MAARAHQNQGINALHQAGVPDGLQSMHKQDAGLTPTPPSARPRAFPLTGSTKFKPTHQGPALDSAFLQKPAPAQDDANATLPSMNQQLVCMQPAPLFANTSKSAQRNLDAAMEETWPFPGTDKNGGDMSGPSGTTANFLACGRGADPIDTYLDADQEVRRSVCQSPTWEAYTQRKQDKRGAKKEKEQEKQTKPKPRRLSKPHPPPSPTSAPRSRSHTQTEREISTLPPSKQQARDHCEIAVKFVQPPPIASSSRASRSRSSSFSSLIKSTFEIRRSSVDLSPDNSFIGGIKLEQQLVAAEDEQRREESRQSKEDELGIHPALRPEGNTRRPGPATSGPPTGTRSRYPPSAWRTSPSTASLIASSPSQTTELSTIKKWRNRVGLRAKRDTAQNQIEDPSARPGAPERQFTSLPVARNSSPSSTAPARHSLDSSRSYTYAFDPAAELPAFENWPGPYTASPPPPEPPLKSPKRKSVGSLDSPTGLKPNLSRLESAEKNPNAYANVPARDAPQRASIDMGQTNPFESNGQKRSFKEAARAAFGKAPPRPSTSVPPNSQTGNRSASSTTLSVRQPDVLRRAQTSSSEGSLSDEYHSTGSVTTNATTPDISRPQSRKGIFSRSPKIAAVSDNKKTVAQRSESSPRPNPASRAGTEDGLDPIQAAALKVNAAFPEAGTRPGTGQREVPRLRHPMLKPADRNKTLVPKGTDSSGDDEHSPDLRELILSKDQSSVAAPWPASYLEAARKAAPSAPVPRNKPTGFPSPSLSTLAGLAPPSPRSQVFSLGPSDSSGGQSPIQTSASSLSGSGTAPTVASGTGSEPLAKMFVECCGCRYYHDMPSKLYEAMSNPEGALGGPGEFAHSSVVSMTVRCPWCQHDMSTRCCAGLAAMVYVKERLH
ncbi:hypothetical protein NLU13_1203 [Sarocladium strictum]|uniref:Uncharacterized protein n=1 Tax=Sarocladium strictum TaxID=5046 RepID=A0AA39GSH0_SARSR|nr:hypothetical protein NLU13_1203 [Sarocladium strictum]